MPSRWIDDLNRELRDRMLDIWDGVSGMSPGKEEFYRNQWRREAGKEVKTSECKWRGQDTGDRVKCGPCADKGFEVRLKLFVCDNPKTKGGRCTLEPADNDVPDCLNCPTEIRNLYRKPPEPVPSEEEVEETVARLRTGFIDSNAIPHDVVRAAHLRLLAEAVEDPPPVNVGEGRGIVMGVGGTVYFACAYVTTSVLRKRGCTLPVEWWHLGPSEIDPNMRRLAAELDATCVDALAVASRLERKPRILNGWELKPFSVAHSSFREVLYLDADSVPTRDPSFLFDHPEYLRHGAIFWPDLPPYDRAEWTPEVVWQNVGLEKREEVDFESGQFMVDKGRRAKELGVTVHINDYSDWYYQFVYGDKTTFHLAWRVCGSDYAITRHSAGWTWPAIQQHDFDGEILFQHVCQGKDQLGRGALENLRDAHLAREAAERLRCSWHGKIWSAVDCTVEESDLMLSLAGTYVYKRTQIVGEPTREIELKADGTIGKGGAACERDWCVRAIDGVTTIVITGSAHKHTQIAMMFLTESSDGIWRGRWQAHERGPVELLRRSD